MNKNLKIILIILGVAIFGGLSFLIFKNLISNNDFDEQITDKIKEQKVALYSSDFFNLQFEYPGFLEIEENIISDEIIDGNIKIKDNGKTVFMISVNKMSRIGEFMIYGKNIEEISIGGYPALQMERESIESNNDFELSIQTIVVGSPDFFYLFLSDREKDYHGEILSSVEFFNQEDKDISFLEEEIIEEVFIKDLGIKVLGKEHQEYINNFKVALESENKNDIAKMVRYPLDRAYPVPEIINENDFINRYEHLFDDKFIDFILKSSTEKDWQYVGWRGIMLNHGEIWIDYDGKISAINYSTKKEESYKQEILEKMGENIHPSLHNYKFAKVYFETKKFKIRIDQMEDDSYRYAAWPIEKSTKEEPDLVIKNGKINYEGSGGNHFYTFINNRYRYEISISMLGLNDAPPAYLIVYKDNKIILTQSAIKFEN